MQASSCAGLVCCPQHTTVTSELNSVRRSRHTSGTCWASTSSGSHILCGQSFTFMLLTAVINLQLQTAKEALEQRQRADAKLRKEGGCAHSH